MITGKFHWIFSLTIWFQYYFLFQSVNIQNMKLSVWSVLCAYILTASVRAHKILVLVPFNGKSHWNYMSVFVTELLNRGHEVTTVTSISLGSKLNNYTEILIDPPYDWLTKTHPPVEDMYSQILNFPFKTFGLLAVVGNTSSDHALGHKKVQELIHSENQHFDLVINEEFYHDVFFAFGHKFNAPTVTICPFGIVDFMDREMGLITPISHVGHVMLSYTDQMNFFQRWYNFALCMYDWFIRETFHAPLQTELLKKYFGHLEALPTFDELRKNISVTFVNAHRSITYPRPSMPGLVYIGGAHIKPPKRLPADLQKFLDESEHGAIYFSLGTIMDSSKMPKEKLNIFFDIFKGLKQRIIWKFENDSIPNVPKNVLIRKWLPQNDILAHPNIVLLISHGGMFSNFEAIKYGVPMLVIPFFGDQYRNAVRAQNLGFGKSIDFNGITHKSLRTVLNEMLTDKQYLTKAKEISAVFGDNVVQPMDEFVWWIEHVIKFRGAKHLKSHAAEMSIFTYLLLDVLLVNLVIIMGVITGMYYMIRRICFKKNDVKNKKE